MKRIISMSVLLIFCFLLQSTLLQYVSFAGIIPNLLIILTASYGFMCGDKNGLLIGFFAGLLCDIFFGDILGFYALIYMYIGYVNGLFKSVFYPEDIKLPLILILSSDFSYNLICYILLFLLKGKIRFGEYFIHIIFPEMVYTILVTCILYPIILFINRKIDSIDKEGAQKFV
ncbi:MAG: rod shape-determining protein MreD [Eubacteriales bacterium]